MYLIYKVVLEQSLAAVCLAFVVLCAIVGRGLLLYTLSPSASINVIYVTDLRVYMCLAKSEFTYPFGSLINGSAI